MFVHYRIIIEMYKKKINNYWHNIISHPVGHL